MSDKHSVKSAQAILLARIQDAVDLCDKRHKPQFIGFLDEKEHHKWALKTICFGVVILPQSV